MGITSKTRKNLWAKSGNRCSICKKELFSKSDSEDILNIGEECHIISSKNNGPRYKKGLSDYDCYENLLLLCRNHHKEIDTLADTYTEKILKSMKLTHEKWVRSTLGNSLKKKCKEPPAFLTRVTSGKELFNMFSNIMAHRIDYDEGENSQEVEYIGRALQKLSDYVDLAGVHLESYDKVKISSELNIFLKELDEKGFFLFAGKKIEDIEHDGMELENWEIVTLALKKKGSSEIIKL